MNSLPFKTKICGIRRAVDYFGVAIAGAGAFGLNFYPGSKRFVTVEAAAFAKSRPNGLSCVGVFVNSTIDEIAAPHRSIGFDFLQLHGDETPEFLAELKAALKLPIIRALRFAPTDSHTIDNYLERAAALQALPDALLLDAFQTGAYGGTGAVADWQAIADWRTKSAIDIPLILAGGLTAENVAEAIRIVRAAAVDTASGVESSPGCKDIDMMNRFVAAANQAYAAM
jgi:phosphoribosylanthranilate isomerase